MMSKDHYSQEETRSFSDYVNGVLKDDIDLKGTIPINPESDDLFKVCSNGLLLCKLINSIKPGTIDEKKIVKKNPNAYEMLINLELAIKGARDLGCSITNIGSKDLYDQNPKLILAVVWQVVKKGLLNKVNLEEHPELVVLLEGDEDLKKFVNISPEENLLRWFNFHLKRAGHPRQVKNFSSDIADGENYLVLLSQIAPNDCPRDLHNEPDPQKRAQMVCDVAQKINALKFVTPQDISKGNDKLNLAFTAYLFNKYPGLDSFDNAEENNRKLKEAEDALKEKMLREEEERKRRWEQEEIERKRRWEEEERMRREQAMREEEERKRQWEEQERKLRDRMNMLAEEEERRRIEELMRQEEEKNMMWEEEMQRQEEERRRREHEEELARQRAYQEEQARQERIKQEQEEMRKRAWMEYQRQMELERQRQMEMERQRQIEMERQRQMEMERQRQMEMERQRQMEMERQRQMEMERQRLMELERQRQMEMERQRQIEIEQQRQLEIQQQLLFQQQQQQILLTQQQQITVSSVKKGTFPITKLLINIIRGRRMPKKDPYCVLMHRGDRYKTASHKNTSKPEWNGSFKLSQVMDTDEVIIQVFDKELLFNDEFMGEVRLEKDDFLLNGERWYTLQSRSYKVDNVSGEILVNITIIKP